MNNIKDWFETITQNKIQARNREFGVGKSLCLNFLLIPFTETTVITLTALVNGRKNIHTFDKKYFGYIMRYIEEMLVDVEEVYEGEFNTNYFCEMNSKEGISKWYSQLNCHRIFFIPESETLHVIYELCNPDFLGKLENCQVEELAIRKNKGFTFVDVRTCQIIGKSRKIRHLQEARYGSY